MKIQQSGIMIVLFALAVPSEMYALRGGQNQQPVRRSMQDNSVDDFKRLGLPGIVDYLQRYASDNVTWGDVEVVAQKLGIVIPVSITEEQKGYILGSVNGAISVARDMEQQQQKQVLNTVKVVKNVSSALRDEQQQEMGEDATKVFNIIQIVSNVSAMANLDQDLEKRLHLLSNISALLSENDENLTPDLIVEAVKQLHLSRYSEDELIKNILADFAKNRAEVTSAILDDVHQYRLKVLLQVVEEHKESEHVFDIIDVVRMVQNAVKQEVVSELNAQSNKLDAQARELMEDSDFQELVQHLRAKDIRLNSFIKLDQAITDISSPGGRKMWKEKMHKMSKAEKETMLRLYQDALRLYTAHETSDEILSSTAHTRTNEVYEVSGRSEGKAWGSAKPSDQVSSEVVMNLEKEATDINTRLGKILSRVEKLNNSLPHVKNKQVMIEKMQQRLKEAEALDTQAGVLFDSALKAGINPVDNDRDNANALRSLFKDIVETSRKIGEIVNLAAPQVNVAEPKKGHIRRAAHGVRDMLARGRELSPSEMTTYQ